MSRRKQIPEETIAEIRCAWGCEDRGKRRRCGHVERASRSQVRGGREEGVLAGRAAGQVHTRGAQADP
jgi:hypothetical protein